MYSKQQTGKFEHQWFDLMVIMVMRHNADCPPVNTVQYKITLHSAQFQWFVFCSHPPSLLERTGNAWDAVTYITSWQFLSHWHFFDSAGNVFVQHSALVPGYKIIDPCALGQRCRVFYVWRLCTYQLSDPSIKLNEAGSVVSAAATTSCRLSKNYIFTKQLVKSV